MSKKTKKVVCFGGGNLVPKVILEPLKRYAFQISSITSMTDNGGSSGQLRKDFNVLPSGDISRHLISLSDASKWKKDLFGRRFGKEKFPGGHVGHRFGTVFISLAEYLLGDPEKAIGAARDFLEIKKHEVLPATIGKTQLMAQLENGKIIEGEDEIDVPKKHNPRLKIKKVFLKPKAKIFPKAKKAIIEADLIILGPGDFYSSLIPCFLSNGMKKAFSRTKAKKVFICNTMTKIGESNGFSVLDFVKEVEKYIGCSLDYVLFHNGTIDREKIKKYRKIMPLVFGLTRINNDLPKGKFIGRDFLAKKELPEYDSKKLIKTIINLCKL